MAENDKTKRFFERWADEGGMRLRVEETNSNGLRFIVIGDEDDVIVTLASFRVADFRRWLNGEDIRPY